MKIFLCGSNQLSTFDRAEIQTFLQQYADKHEIHILCYKTIESEVLRFFVENEQLASHLFIYTIQPLHIFTTEFQKVVSFLSEQGAYIRSFDHANEAVYRSTYVSFVKKIIEDMDLILCFYNGDKHTAVIPVDTAKEIQKDAIIYDLPGTQEIKKNKQFEEKLRMM
ncbi:flagellar motor switch protein FliG [Bacillus manliponensis]|uniref:flagellar motor switch protein FliG n=1 Tax=Bacillus manliponensis TaxID=574376 RepID=UPI003516C22E